MSGTSSARPGTPAPHDELTARLEHELERATAHVTAQEAEYDVLLADPEVIQEDRDAAAVLLAHARQQLDAATTALERHRAGTYGRCVTCGGAIGEERLAALVDVTTCVSCAG
jgi:RNA polymerase-binding transcription factor DksA